jgi:hypothetical protein
VVGFLETYISQMFNDITSLIDLLSNSLDAFDLNLGLHSLMFPYDNKRMLDP